MRGSASVVRRRCGIVCLLGIMVVASFAADASAHGARNTNVRALVDPLPAALEGMRIEVHSTIAPQLVIENPTGRVVEVLDPDGVSFLRIGAHGVEGNLNAHAWYVTYGPGAVVPAIASNEPRWLRVRAESTFGWFEPRVDPASIEVPHAVVDSGRGADVGRWAIPLRVDGEPVSLKGHFRFEPPPTGAYVARMTSPPRIAPGVHVTLLPGRVPGLMVENTSAYPLTVVGMSGEPFLRIGPDGVDANTRSETWRRSARRPQIESADEADYAGTGPDWQRVARTPRFSWIEPRATASPGRDVRGSSWQVPMTLGDDQLYVAGTVSWKENVTTSSSGW